MESKVTIHEFDPVIYPFRLWVAVRPKVEQVAEMFYNLDSSMNRIDVTPDDFNKSVFAVGTI